MVFQLLASSESQSIEISPPHKIIKMRSSIHFSRESTLVFKIFFFSFRCWRRKNIRQIDSGRSVEEKMGFTEKKWSSSQLTRDHFSRDDDHPLVFKLGSETVVKSSCFTIIDYLPKRSRKTYISIAQKASGKPKDFSHSCVSPSNSMFTNQNQSSNPLAH